MNADRSRGGRLPRDRSTFRRAASARRTRARESREVPAQPGASKLAMAVAMLFDATGSGVVDATLAVLVIVDPGIFPMTTTSICKAADSPAATEDFEKTTLPAPKRKVPGSEAAGMFVVQSLGACAEKKVVPAGIASVTITLCADDGPRLVNSNL